MNDQHTAESRMLFQLWVELNLGFQPKGVFVLSVNDQYTAESRILFQPNGNALGILDMNVRAMWIDIGIPHRPERAG